MNFSYSKQTLLRPQKEKYLSAFFIALFVAAARGIWYNVVKPARPAGDSFAASQLNMGKEGWKTI